MSQYLPVNALFTPAVTLPTVKPEVPAPAAALCTPYTAVIVIIAAPGAGTLNIVPAPPCVFTTVAVAVATAAAVAPVVISISTFVAPPTAGEEPTPLTLYQ